MEDASSRVSGCCLALSLGVVAMRLVRSCGFVELYRCVSPVTYEVYFELATQPFTNIGRKRVYYKGSEVKQALQVVRMLANGQPVVKY